MTRAQAHGLLRGDLDVDELSEWVLRCLLSLLTVDGPRHHTAEDERRLLATFLSPALLPGSIPSPLARPAPPLP
jgi:hypothetical protein